MPFFCLTLKRSLIGVLLVACLLRVNHSRTRIYTLYSGALRSAANVGDVQLFSTVGCSTRVANHTGQVCDILIRKTVSVCSTINPGYSHIGIEFASWIAELRMDAMAYYAIVKECSSPEGWKWTQCVRVAADRTLARMSPQTISDLCNAMATLRVQVAGLTFVLGAWCSFAVVGLLGIGGWCVGIVIGIILGTYWPVRS